MVSRDGVQRTAALLMTSAMSRSRSGRMLPASAALIADTGHWLGWSHSLPGGVVPVSRSNCCHGIYLECDSFIIVGNIK